MESLLSLRVYFHHMGKLAEMTRIKMPLHPAFLEIGIEKKGKIMYNGKGLR